MICQQDTRESGMLMAEIMIWVILFNILAVSTLTVSTQQRKLHRQTVAYAKDLESCRRTLLAIERDSREADSVVILPQQVDLKLSGRDIQYKLQDGDLLRIEDGKVLKLSKRIARFKLHRTGRLLDLELELKRRKEMPDARKAKIVTSILLRNVRMHK